MTKLPATFAEANKANIVARARECVRTIKNEKISWWGLKLSWFEKSDNREWIKHWMKTMAADPSWLLDLDHRARAGWGIAHDVMCELIVEYQHNNVEMPPPLKTYSMLVAREAADPSRRYRRTRGQQKSDFLLRDFAIVACVYDVCWKFGIPPTRNRASKRWYPSGCWAVAEALPSEGLDFLPGEAGIVKIWTCLGQRAFEGGVKALGEYP